MITGMTDSKLPPFPRDSKAPLDTPPAYSEEPARAPPPREVYTSAVAVPTPPPASNPFSQSTSTSSASQAAPQQLFTHAWPVTPAPSAPQAPPAPPAAPMQPSPPPPPPAPHAYPQPCQPGDASSFQGSSKTKGSSSGAAAHAYPQPGQPGDASSYQSSSKTKSSSSGVGAGKKAAKAVGQGMFALVAMPVVVTAAALYGSGKLVEGIGRGLSAGPGAVLKAYRKMDGKIKGEGKGGRDGDGGRDGKEEEEAREREWHRYQHQQQVQQQQQHQYQYEYGQGEGGMGLGAPPMEEDAGLKPKLGERSLRMPMGASLMEDPSIGMAGGSNSGSIRAKH